MTYRGQTSPNVGTSGGTSFSSTIGGNVGNGANAVFATDANGNPIGLTNQNGGPILASFSKEGQYALGALAIDQLPNNTLGDTVTTQQQMAFATIPGGLFGPKSIIEVNLTGNFTGNDSKTIGFKAGAASGNMASAVAFGGTGGVTTQVFVGSKAILWGNGVLGQQRASPNGPVNWSAANAASPVTLGIDTSLDWNIYVYFQSTVAAGAPTNSFQLRAFWATWLR